jgi:hypothetical protein
MANYSRRGERVEVPGTAAAVNANNRRRRQESQQAEVTEAQERLNALRAAARMTTHANRFGTMSEISATRALRTAQARYASQR